MTWSRKSDVVAHVQRIWDRGALLRSVIPYARVSGIPDNAPGALDLESDETPSATEREVDGAVVNVVVSLADKLEKEGSDGDIEQADASGTAASTTLAYCRFPLRLALKGPTTQEFLNAFGQSRLWIEAIAGLKIGRIEWRDVNHRQLGSLKVPKAIWLDSPEDALRVIGRAPEARQYQQIFSLAMARYPAIAEWTYRFPLRALALENEYPQLLNVIDWMLAHPRPSIYLRQIDIAGINSKYVERWSGVLDEWLCYIQPQEHASSVTTGTTTTRFIARYGFLEKPARIRFRILDPGLNVLPGAISPDIEMDAASFGTLRMSIQRVFITENETNFLAFPQIQGAIVIFGKGYGWEAYAHVPWLSNCDVYYWGDIDTHGFAILDQLRKYVPHAHSILMDHATLMAHRLLWGHEASQERRELTRLDPHEQWVYNNLRENTWGDGLRLEQEHIGFTVLLSTLARFVER